MQVRYQKVEQCTRGIRNKQHSMPINNSRTNVRPVPSNGNPSFDEAASKRLGKDAHRDQDAKLNVPNGDRLMGGATIKGGYGSAK